MLGYVLAVQHRPRESINRFERALRANADSSADDLAALGYGYAMAGSTATAMRLLGQAIERKNAHGGSAADIALLYEALGNREQAIGWLERAYLEHDSDLEQFVPSPLLDPLRGDVRFQELRRRMHRSDAPACPFTRHEPSRGSVGERRDRLDLDLRAVPQLIHRHDRPCRTMLAEHARVHGIDAWPERDIADVNGHLEHVIESAPRRNENRFDVAEGTFGLLFNGLCARRRVGRVDRQLPRHVHQAPMHDRL